jgi:hypothetical protein
MDRVASWGETRKLGASRAKLANNSGKGWCASKQTFESLNTLLVV